MRSPYDLDVDNNPEGDLREEKGTGDSSPPASTTRQDASGGEHNDVVIV